jgi:ubiquitin carboxyl-terminal hydrolase 9/24
VPEFNHAASLSTRLQILRFVYGLDLNPSTENELSCQQVQQLWNVCVQPTDREALMMFLANASKPDDGTYNQLNDGSLESSRTGNPVRNISSLSPCFSDNVYIFENLFCADVGGPGWENLGELAYQSFQSFDAKESRNSPLTTDALWRICLSAGNDSVAARAMNDLLTVYMNGNNVTPASEGSENSKFSQRIFDCLVQVKEGLKVGNRSSERSAERCIRILSAAIEKCNSLGANAGAVAERFGALLGEQHEGSSPATVEEYLNLVPHGMRGVYSCNTVSIIARATTRGGNHSANTGSAPIDAVAGDDSATLSNRPERFLLEIHPLQTLASIKHQIASHCNHDEKRMKLNNLSGQKRSANGDLDPRLSTLPDATLAADLGIVEGSEIIALLSDKIVANNVTTGDNVRVNNVAVHLPTLGPTTEHSKEHLLPSSCSPSTSSTLDLTGLFSRNGLDGSSNLFFDTLMSVLELLPVDATSIINNNGWNKTDTGRKGVDSHSLAWDLLSAMPTNAGIIAKVHAACSATSKATPSGDDMAVEFIGGASDWSSLLDFRHFERSVYVMQILDSFLRPAHVIFSSLPGDVAADLTQSMSGMAMEFRTNFIKSGGFEAVLRLFILSGKSIDKNMARRNKMGNECALRIIKECFFASNGLSTEGLDMINSLDGETIGKFLNSLVAITIDDSGASDHAILRVLKLVRMMLESGGPTITTSFTTLPGDAAETFLTSLLLWKGSGSLASTGFRSAVNIRKSTEEMILAIPLLSASALPWLVRSLKNIDPFTDGSDEFFSVLLKLVNSVNHIQSASELRELGAAVCIKVASCPRPNCDTANTDHSTGVLCGCLNLLIALIEVSGDNHSCFLVEGARHITRTLPIIPWSEEICSESVEQWEHESLSANDKSIIDLMGAIFDGFISTARSSELSPICCDSFSRHLAFNVISAAAHACRGGAGYRILSQRINRIIANVAPALRHRWGANASAEDRIATRDTNSVLYSGLKNQGCTCYMNSVLQQLFMMPALRKNLCSAKLPTILRSSGGGAIAKGSDLVGNQISVHWENGNKYEAIVMNYNEATGMHTINYRPIQVATDVGHHNPGPDINSLPRDLLEEFILTEGRPGKETGAFEISSNIWSESAADESLDNGDSKPDAQETPFVVNESPDESSSRKLLEEVQRTFVNLEEARGRCFDPRSLVEASHCLKLEFDVWQQNDASEFAMKLLDRLEISLKKWSPSHFKYLAHTFGMKKTTQKICRECGLKVRITTLWRRLLTSSLNRFSFICIICSLQTNREENMMNIDCQIRNKTSIHEALSDMCEDEIMEGDNKVLCETCQVKTNTVLRTAISALPDVLVLSLKRFDLDYTTFETVKLNSRCEFGEALNMKQYTLQAKEVLEAAGEKPEEEMKSESGSMMDLDETETKEEAKEDDPLSVLPDEDYEYRLAGVLVHAGVAQGGHYYSFIKDRTCAKWYRFDDEDVTPFDPCSIEHECFGGKVKKETKLPNGQSHTVVSEQFANALMLFYEKVKPVTFPSETEAEKTDAGAGDALMEVDAKAVLSNIESSDGFEVFLPGVRKSNSTHCWQSFLLTDEFQTFVKKLIDHCTGGNRLKSEEDSMDITPMSSPSPDLPGLEIDSWRLDVIRMSLSFVFDILFHLSSKKAALGDWSQTLIRIFSSSWDLSARFVSDLAKRSHHVYKNWIRAYTMECPEEGSRRAALQIFACAMHSLLSSPTEQTLLKNWTRGWSFQESKLRERACHQVEALPTKLELTELRPLEDTAELGVTATSLGVILSFLSELIEVSPRYSQANIDLCFFIRELADAKDPTVGKFLRDAMVESHFVTRLICLALSELSPLSLKYKFPGSSVPSDIAVAISRGESPLSVLVGTSNSGVHGQFGGSSQLLVETVGCLLGLPWIKQVAISYETGEINRGRAIRSLTQPAIAALTAVFEESKPPSSAGMTPRDIQFYLQKCGQHVPPQRIEQIFQRHAVDDPNGMRLLTLTGFLNYYRDAVHNSEYQVSFVVYFSSFMMTRFVQLDFASSLKKVQKELHAFGFRPDLTRRSDDCRWYVDESGQKRPCSARESIANEIVMNRTSLSRFPALTEIGLHTLHFMNYACGCGINGAVEYLLAAAACGRKSQAMIYECLDYLHRHIGNWGGGNNSDAYSLIITVCQSFYKRLIVPDVSFNMMSLPSTFVQVLTMLTAIPDEKQQARISMIMMNDESDAHLGLLIKGDHLIRDYPNDYRARMHAEKYSDFLRVLRKQHAVSNWMSRNRAYCAWIEPEAHPETVHPLQTRSDHPDRRSGGYQNAPEHLQNHNPNAEDDSGLDDDSRSDDDDDLVHDMVVDRCGVPEVNGVFRRDGTSDGVWKYTKRIRYRGREEEFSLYRCRLTDSTR